MRIPNCVGCAKPILQLQGQFTLLDSFYLNGDADPPEESAGNWHIHCLAASGFGAAWQRLRLENFMGVRDYEQIGDPGEWIVLQHPRTKEPMALSGNGGLLSLSFGKGSKLPAQDGFIYEVEKDESHLELADPEIIRVIQTSLTSTKSFPIPTLFEMLGIEDLVMHSEALRRGLIHHNARLQPHWTSTSVSARWNYGVFVPSELDPYVIRKR